MKDIKDYLHLYLGSKVFVFPANTLEDGWYKNAKEENEMPDGWGTYIVTADNYKKTIEDGYFLILRPLSDMTEEELNELLEFGEHYRMGYSVEEFVIGWKAFGANTFKYLLSKGFDLFGLIESGLAIDKTKL